MKPITIRRRLSSQGGWLPSSPCSNDTFHGGPTHGWVVAKCRGAQASQCWEALLQLPRNTWHPVHDVNMAAARRLPVQCALAQFACLRRGGTAAHQVEWQAVVGKGDGEEHQVHEEVEQICEELQVEDVDALLLPAPLHVGVDAGQHVLDKCAAGRWGSACQHEDVSAAGHSIWHAIP